MKIVLFYHSLLSDWNHGNAHFLRGVATELIARGNDVAIYEPENSWSLSNLRSESGEQALREFHDYYPLLSSTTYTREINLDAVLAGADLVIVHEWNEHWLVKAVGEKRKVYGFRLLFHDTHHRAVTDRESMRAYDLSNYDGVLAFGNVIRDLYIRESRTRKAWTWHEAADTRVFKPLAAEALKGDLVWIGNWGDDERTKELFEFLIEPVRELGLKAKVYGVRYPGQATKALREAGIGYGGWLPNFKVPEVFSQYRLTVHVPRRPYVQALPGIPTIRPFEALACGIPLLSAPWNDCEHLFTPGKDLRFAGNKTEMKALMKTLLTDDAVAAKQAADGLQTVRQRHTCSIRVDELYTICEELNVKNLNRQNILS